MSFECVIDLLRTAPLVVRVALVALLPTTLTMLGSVPILIKVRFSEGFIDGGMGFAAGVMLVASFTSLLLPAVSIGGVSIAISGFVAGIILIRVLDVLIPHMHLRRGSEGSSKYFRYAKKAWLMALAIILHNIPEGMAVGSSTIYSVTDGLVLATAIALQDIPEGFAAALPILDITKSRAYAFSIGALSGVAEFLAAFIPLLIITFIGTALPLMLAIASGAMVYVVIHEIIPEIYGHEHDEQSTIGFFIGFILMLILDTMF